MPCAINTRNDDGVGISGTDTLIGFELSWETYFGWILTELGCLSPRFPEIVEELPNVR
jgi:hypothetical protein